MNHHSFISSTDRKSLYTHIKGLVEKAKDVANDELDERRKRLQSLLDYEDKIYEEEFTNNVKSRIDEDIKERKNVLLKIKEESERNALEFLHSKRIQQYMESCYEIREVLQHKETQHVKECQMEQIMENERGMRRQRELDKYWEDVLRTNLDREDNRQAKEDCLKKKLNEDMKRELGLQMQEIKFKKHQEHREKAEDAGKLSKVIEEIRLEDFERQQLGKPQNMLQYRKELQNTIADKRKLRYEKERRRAERHCFFIQDVQRAEAEKTVAALQRKRDMHKESLEYIAYVKRMRQLEQSQQKILDDRMDDLRHVDICTKNNIQRQAQRKAEEAARCHAVVKRQICEEYNRRHREEKERRECKIIENRFIHEELTREQILAKRRENREQLDEQIIVREKIRAAEETQRKKHVMCAINDPELCAQLADKYIHEGVDYLKPHPNWRILACPKKEYVSKVTRSAGDVHQALGGNRTCIPCGRVSQHKFGDGSK